MADLIMSFDVESVGLHGEGFAVGWVVLDRDNRPQESGYAACDMGEAKGADSDREWVAENVCPHLDAPTHLTPREVRDWFWTHWQRWKERGAVLIADCAWPVEARFLAACVDDEPEERRWGGPYPLHDVASMRLAAGFDPLATVGRLPHEGPAHHPTADAMQSGRLWWEAVAALADGGSAG